MRDEVMTLLLAGHETTAATLAWTWYLLARHPEAERRLSGCSRAWRSRTTCLEATSSLPNRTCSFAFTLFTGIRIFWEEAEDFNPQRFAPEHDTPRRSSSYLPFGAGPRTCLGSRFGLMEVVLVVAVIAQRYSLKLSAEQRVEANASLTLHPRGGLAMRLHRRT